MRALPVLAVTILGAAVGFAFGFTWGQGTRSALPDATKTDFTGGVLTVSVNAKQAALSGLSAIFG